MEGHSVETVRVQLFVSNGYSNWIAHLNSVFIKKKKKKRTIIFRQKQNGTE